MTESKTTLENGHTNFTCNYRSQPVGYPGCICDRPVEELIAGDNFRKTMIPHAEDRHNLMWHGWVIMDAFLAGIQWKKNRVKS